MRNQRGHGRPAGRCCPGSRQTRSPDTCPRTRHWLDRSRSRQGSQASCCRRAGTCFPGRTGPYPGTAHRRSTPRRRHHNRRYRRHTWPHYPWLSRCPSLRPGRTPHSRHRRRGRSRLPGHRRPTDIARHGCTGRYWSGLLHTARLRRTSQPRSHGHRCSSWRRKQHHCSRCRAHRTLGFQAGNSRIHCTSPDGESCHPRRSLPRHRSPPAQRQRM